MEQANFEELINKINKQDLYHDALKERRFTQYIIKYCEDVLSYSQDTKNKIINTINENKELFSSVLRKSSVTGKGFIHMYIIGNPCETQGTFVVGTDENLNANSVQYPYHNNDVTVRHIIENPERYTTCEQWISCNDTARKLEEAVNVTIDLFTKFLNNKLKDKEEVSKKMEEAIQTMLKRKDF